MAVHPVDEHIGARIWERRKQIGLSQHDLGDAIGVTFQQVQKYEKGTNRVGGSRLHRIGRVLGVEVGYFFEGLVDSDTTSSMPPVLPELTARQIAAQLRELAQRIEDDLTA